MSLKQRFIYKASIGFSLGVFVTIGFCLIAVFSDDPFTNILTKEYLLRLVIQLLCGGLMGIVGNGGAVIYEVDRWSIIRMTVTHFVLTFVTFLILGFANNWLEPRLSLFNVIMILGWILTYFIIWMTQYLIYKKEVDQINRSLKTLRDSKEAS